MSNERSNWAIGYEAFAAMLMIMIGFFHAIAGIVALIDDQFYVVGNEWTFKFDTTTWGWIHLLMGIIVLLAGIGIFTGNVLARTIGVILAVISAIANFLWLPYYPIWSVVIIALNIAIIWALTVHGRDIVPDRN